MTIKTFVPAFLLAAMLLFTAGFVTACDQDDGPAEELGEKIDNAVK